VHKCRYGFDGLGLSTDFVLETKSIIGLGKGRARTLIRPICSKQLKDTSISSVCGYVSW
jgi:hypothetical protein